MIKRTFISLAIVALTISCACPPKPPAARAAEVSAPVTDGANGIRLELRTAAKKLTVRVHPSPEMFQIYVGAPLRVRAARGDAKPVDAIVGDDGVAELSFARSKGAPNALTFEWFVLDVDGAFFSLSHKYQSDITPAKVGSSVERPVRAAP